jgi:hypothetical protein
MTDIKVLRKVSPNDHPLRPLTSTRVPNFFLFFDTETKAYPLDKIELHKFRIAYTCLWNRNIQDRKKAYLYEFWDDKEKLCKYIEETAKRYKGLILIAHNIFFDLQVSGFFEYFAHWGWRCKFIYDVQSTFILKCFKDSDELTCLSSTNWFDAPLKELGKLAMLKKIDIDTQTENIDMLKKYCRRDVQILVRVIRYYIEFIIDNDLGKFSYTKASQAFSAWRTRFMPKGIRIHTNKDAVTLERQAYMGGRTECFYIGKVKGRGFVTLDINSMYPYVMKEYKYPTQLVDYKENPSNSFVQRVLNDYSCIAEVIVKTNEPVYALKLRGKTIFPVGEFTTYLCTQGLQHAISKGHVQEIKKITLYTNADLFSEYVTFMHNLRYKYKSLGNKVMVVLCKYLENALYGKFGQKYYLEEHYEADGEHEYYREQSIDIVNHRWVMFTHILNEVIVRYGEEEGKNAFVAIAAHITENARLLLWNIIDSIGHDRVLYCDTDSVKIRLSDLSAVKWQIADGVLGALKIEDTCNSLFIAGNKYYITEKNKKIKGIPKAAVEIAPGVYEFYSWPKMTYHLREGIIQGYERKKIRRTVSLNYDKGIVTPSGKVLPFQLPF